MGDSDPLSKEAIERLRAKTEVRSVGGLPLRRVMCMRADVLALLDAHTRLERENAALLAERDRLDHRKAAAVYAEHVTCQHGREPGAACVPCSWAARIVELEGERDRLLAVAEAATELPSILLAPHSDWVAHASGETRDGITWEICVRDEAGRPRCVVLVSGRQMADIVVLDGGPGQLDEAQAISAALVWSAIRGERRDRSKVYAEAIETGNEREDAWKAAR